ncbi:MAG TPA: lactate utilization protein [Bryobacteraceae bacterium]|nr:lactate utilization protein [Bryobacteraceae bacterium]
MSRDAVLNKVRTALGRRPGQGIAEAPAVRLRVAAMDPETRVESMLRAVEALAGKTHRAATPDDARAYVAAVIDGRTAVASNAPYLRDCGIVDLPCVQSDFTDAAALRAVCATVDVGITSADYALADTGSLVMLASPAEARLISLLPPVHIAVVPKERLLSGLDELLTILPDPAAETSSMVLITGPSRTADIEQILVRGVHGPGEIHVVVVG